MLQLLQQIHLRRRVRTGRTQAERRTPDVAAARVVAAAVVMVVVIVHHHATAAAPGDGVVIVMATVAHHDVRRVVQGRAGRSQHLGVIGVMVGRVFRQGNRLRPFVEDGRVRCRLVPHVVLGHVRVDAAVQLRFRRRRFAELGPEAFVGRLDSFATFFDLIVFGGKLAD